MIHRRARERGEVAIGVTTLAGHSHHRHMIAGQYFQHGRRHVGETQTCTMTGGTGGARHY